MKWVSFTLSVLLSMTMILVFFAVVPEMETKFYPVYSKFRLVNAQQVGDKTIASFEFTKFRNCAPQGFGFYAGELGATAQQLSVRVRASDLRRLPVPLGTQISAPYEIEGITAKELSNTVYAIVYSHCHFLWITRSVIFP